MLRYKYLFLALCLYACANAPKQKAPQLALEATEKTYSYSLYTIDTKENPLGSHQCDKYETLKVDSMGFDYYGASFEHLMRHLFGDGACRIDNEALLPNTFFHLQYQGPRSASDYSMLARHIAQYYGYKVEQAQIEEEVCLLSVGKQAAMSKPSSPLSPSIAITGHSLVAKDVMLSSLAKLLTAHYHQPFAVAKHDSSSCSLHIDLPKHSAQLLDKLQAMGIDHKMHKQSRVVFVLR